MRYRISGRKTQVQDFFAFIGSIVILTLIILFLLVFNVERTMRRTSDATNVLVDTENPYLLKIMLQTRPVYSKGETIEQAIVWSFVNNRFDDLERDIKEYYLERKLPGSWKVVIFLEDNENRVSRKVEYKVKKSSTPTGAFIFGPVFGFGTKSKAEQIIPYPDDSTIRIELHRG